MVEQNEAGKISRKLWIFYIFPQSDKNTYIYQPYSTTQVTKSQTREGRTFNSYVVQFSNSIFSKLHYRFSRKIEGY